MVSPIVNKPNQTKHSVTTVMISRHNIKSHADTKHKGHPVKGRLKRESSLEDFVVTAHMKAKVAENVEKVIM